VSRELLIEFEEATRIEGTGWFVKLVFEVAGDLRSGGGERKIEIAILPDALG